MSVSFLPQEIIRQKRNGGTLNRTDIQQFVDGITDGSVSEGQIAALAMAVFFQGMQREETIALTKAMRNSGDVLDWSELNGPVLDKHSTGGVGDNISLMLAPGVAACGGFVPMISGRGLGHTGGTLDKLDTIPGYTTQPDNSLFRRVTKSIGCAIIGQTDNLAPADKRFYGVRDVTATVEAVPLITASILSKKLAAGLGGLVLDVKCGNGAFMNNLDEARALADSLVNVADGAGLPTTAILTDMNEPLARAAGNALEVKDALDFLTGYSVDPRAWDVTIALGAEMLMSGGLTSSLDQAKQQLEQAYTSGRAAEIFGKMVAELGGPVDFIESPERHLPHAPIVRPVFVDGCVIDVDTRAVGVTVLGLGGGRTRASDTINPSVGLSDLAALGQIVDSETPLGIVHAQSGSDADAAVAALKAAYTLGNPRDVPERPVTIERVVADQ